MNGYNFTERVRKALAMAREESARLRHEYVGTEHILLGLIREGEGVAMAVLSNLGVDADKLKEQIERVTGMGNAPPAAPDIPYTSRISINIELRRRDGSVTRQEFVKATEALSFLAREAFHRGTS